MSGYRTVKQNLNEKKFLLIIVENSMQVIKFQYYILFNSNTTDGFDIAIIIIVTSLFILDYLP